MKSVYLQGMLGIGDCLHQRAILRVLMQDHDVTLRTFYAGMYHDLVAQGLKLDIVPDGARIRESTRVRSNTARRGNVRQITYNRTTILQHGSILAAMFASAHVPMPEKPDFSLPVLPEWRAAARRLIGDLNRVKVRGKGQHLPICVYRPIVLNNAWRAPARAPDPRAYADLFAEIRERYFVVSVANLGEAGEAVVGPRQEVDLPLERGEALFESLAGMFAEAQLVFGCPGYVPVLAQAVGAANIIVYGGNESFRTTNSVGRHLAPTLAIEPVKPCECHQREHDCDKTIHMPTASTAIAEFLGRPSVKIRQRAAKVEPRVLIFGTVFCDTADKADLARRWAQLHHHINPACDLVLVDSGSPLMPKLENVKVLQAGENIGHLARAGKDGWGRAFTRGLQHAIDERYGFAVHIEGDSLFRLPVMPIIREMQRDSVRAFSVPVRGTMHNERNWVETGLMFLNVPYWAERKLIQQYDWPSRRPPPAPPPEPVLWRLLGNGLVMEQWRAARGDRGEITLQNCRDFDWITHVPLAVAEKFASLHLPQTTDGPMVKLNFGCGTNKLAGWQNFDAEVDISKPLPFRAGYADYILAEHVVEHVDMHTALRFFRDCHHVLRPGGVLRIAVPCVGTMVCKADDAYMQFVAKWASPGMTGLRGALDAMFFAHGHMMAWSSDTLRAAMLWAGFVDLQNRRPGISDHAELRDVEGHAKVIGANFNDIETIVVEGTARDD